MPSSRLFFLGPSSSAPSPPPTPLPAHSPPIPPALSILLHPSPIVLRPAQPHPDPPHPHPPSVLSGSVLVALADHSLLSALTVRVVGLLRLDFVDGLTGKRFRADSNLFSAQLALLHSPLSLASGNHLIPFSIALPPHLPPALSTASRSASIFYKLRANATASPCSLALHPPSSLPSSPPLLPHSPSPPPLSPVYSSSSISSLRSSLQNKLSSSSLSSLSHSHHPSLNALLLKPLNSWLSGSRPIESPKTYLNVLKLFDSLHSPVFTLPLDIENIWPEKISYQIGLPRKAFAAGETIPIPVKFLPLLKGVRVQSLVVTVKESVTILAHQGSLSPHVENRDVAEFKFEFHHQNHGPAQRSEPASRPSHPLHSSSFPNNHGGSLVTPSDFHTLTRRLEAVSSDLGQAANQQTLLPLKPPRIRSTSLVHSTPPPPVPAGDDSSPVEDSNLSVEIDEVLGIDLPLLTTPSHPNPPVIVHHKLRFSVLILNPDGHKSELRCALPLIIVPNQLAQEVRLAANGLIPTHEGGLHYHPSGWILDHPLNRFEEQALPSYPEHILDRLPSVTPIEHSPSAQAGGEANQEIYVPAPWSSYPHSSPSTPSLGCRSPTLGAMVPSLPSGSASSTRRSSFSQGYFSPHLHTHTTAGGGEEHGLGVDAEQYLLTRGRMSHNSSQSSSRRSSPGGLASTASTVASTTGTCTATGSGTSTSTTGAAAAPLDHHHHHHHHHQLKKPMMLRLPKALTKMNSRTPPPPPPPPLDSCGFSSPLPLGTSHSKRTTATWGEPGGTGRAAGPSNCGGISEGSGVVVPPSESIESEEVLSRIPSYELSNLETESMGKSVVPLSSLIGLPNYDEVVEGLVGRGRSISVSGLAVSTDEGGGEGQSVEAGKNVSKQQDQAP